jgi:hypothetical protein
MTRHRRRATKAMSFTVHSFVRQAGQPAINMEIRSRRGPWDTRDSRSLIDRRQYPDPPRTRAPNPPAPASLRSGPWPTCRSSARTRKRRLERRDRERQHPAELSRVDRNHRTARLRCGMGEPDRLTVLQTARHLFFSVPLVVLRPMCRLIIVPQGC